MIKFALVFLLFAQTMGVAHANNNDWPAVSTQIIELGDYQQNSNEGCRNHALSVMSNLLSLSNIGVTGNNTTYATIGIQGHDYSLVVRCQVEHKIVFFAIAGPLASNAHKALVLFQEAWAPQPTPPEPEQERKSVEHVVQAKAIGKPLDITPKKVARQNLNW